MKIAQTYSHLNGQEFLMVHHAELYKELLEVIASIDANACRTKISKEIRMKGKVLISPRDLNKSFEAAFDAKGWKEDRYAYYISLDRETIDKSVSMELKEQRAFIAEADGQDPIYSYNQTDFVKDKVAVEVQFGKYAFVAFDLFVKHMLFYSGGKIDVGIEILPTKKMQQQMSSGVAYYEGEVYNVMRQGRTSPPVPLFIIGIEPEDLPDPDATKAAAAAKVEQIKIRKPKSPDQ